MSEEMMEHRIHEWITVNDLHGKPLRYGSFPLGMVQNFIERAEKSDATIAALKQRVAELERDNERERNAHAGTAGSHARLRAELATMSKELEAARKLADAVDGYLDYDVSCCELGDAVAAYRATQSATVALDGSRAGKED